MTLEQCARMAVMGLMTNGKPLWVLLADNNKTAEDMHDPIRRALESTIMERDDALEENKKLRHELETAKKRADDFSNLLYFPWAT